VAHQLIFLSLANFSRLQCVSLIFLRRRIVIRKINLGQTLPFGASFATTSAQKGECMATREQTESKNADASAEPTEDEFTKTIERYTASIPSSAYLAVAVGAMGLSLLFQVTGRGKWGNFIAQWVPTWLVIGLYNKVVKVEGHDQTDRGS
jgi:hypothetical protein